MRVVQPKNQEFIDLMRRANMSQADVAKAMHYSTATVSRWKTGKLDVEDAHLDHLARIVGMRPSSESMDTMSEGPIWLDDWQIEVLALFGLIKPDRRAAVIAALRELVSAVTPGNRYVTAKRNDVHVSQEVAVAHDHLNAGKSTKLYAEAAEKSAASLPPKSDAPLSKPSDLPRKRRKAVAENPDSTKPQSPP